MSEVAYSAQNSPAWTDSDPPVTTCRSSTVTSPGFRREFPGH